MWLLWRPCAAGQGPDGFSAACLTAMDVNAPLPIPLPPAELSLPETLGAVAMLVLATAWLVVLPTLQVGRLARLALGSPAVLAMVGAAAAALQAPEALTFVLFLAIDFAVVGVLLALVAGRLGGTDVNRVRYAIVLVGATAMSHGHLMVEYTIAIGRSDADWDTPPNTGYVTVVGLLLAALVTAGWCLLERRRSRSDPAPALVAA